MSDRQHYQKGELFDHELQVSLLPAERPDGRELFAVGLLIAPQWFDVHCPGILGAFDALTTAVLLTPMVRATDCELRSIVPKEVVGPKAMAEFAWR